MNNASKHLTGVFVTAVAATVTSENTALPSSEYSLIPLAALAHPSNFALLYPVPFWFTVNPVTSLSPTVADASDEGGSWIKIVGGSVALYPEPKLVILISIIWPLKIDATAVAPVPPA